jgi:Spy/CpxP family protein refolding chaperone
LKGVTVRATGASGIFDRNTSIQTNETMKKPGFYLRLIILLIAAGLAPSESAQTPGQRPQGLGAGDRFFPALSRVLTDEQRGSLRAALEPQRDIMQPLEEKLRASRRALLDAVAGGKFDEAAARQNAEASAQAEAELTVIFARALAQMQPPLSTQQIEQLKNFQPGQFQSPSAPGPHLELPPPLPRDSNDLPIVTPPK